MAETKDQYYKYCEFLSELTGVQFYILNLQTEQIQAGKPDQFCETCPISCDYVHMHMEASKQSYCWYGKYIYSCSAGLLFGVTALSGRKNKLRVAAVMGPVINESLETYRKKSPKMAGNCGIENLPVLSFLQIGSLIEIMRAIVISSRKPYEDSFMYERERLIFDLYEFRKTIREPDKAEYPLYLEFDFEQCVFAKDRVSAEKAVKGLVRYIVECVGTLEEQKAYLEQLIGVFSRVVIKAGKDSTPLLEQTRALLIELTSVEDQGGLFDWISDMLRVIMDLAFNESHKKTVRIANVIKHIETNYQEYISVESLCSFVGMSRSYLSTQFKEETGLSITEYINMVRIRESKRLLLETTNSIADIAVSCGFDNQSYFSRIFKAKTGITPRKYRDSAIYND